MNMKTLIASTLVSFTALSSTAMAGGGSTSTETGFPLRGLSCQNAKGELTVPEIKSVDLGNSQILDLSDIWYDFFDVTFELRGELNGCSSEVRFEYDAKGLLTPMVNHTISSCDETKAALISVYEKTDITQLEDMSVHIITNLDGEKVCGDAKSKVIAVFGG